MEERLKNSLDNIRKSLEGLSKEEIEKYFPKDTTPTGWVDIEEHLPMVTCQDVIDNGGLFKNVKVKNKDGHEWECTVGDHHMWYYLAKEAGVTHWYNPPSKEEEDTTP